MLKIFKLKYLIFTFAVLEHLVISLRMQQLLKKNFLVFAQSFAHLIIISLYQYFEKLHWDGV